MTSFKTHSPEASWDFGFLKHPKSIDFDGGKVLVREEFDAASEHVERYRHRDGYLYPPLQRTVPVDIESGRHGEPMANTERPARVFPPPLSHSVSISAPVVTGDIRRGDASVVIHLLALLFETRLQFRGWKFDGRIPIPDNSSILLLGGSLEDALSRVYWAWRHWPEVDRAYFVKIMYMHARAKTCEWEWYQFLTEYMVLDAIYKFCLLRGLLSNVVKHEDRLRQMCDLFEVPQEADTIKRIVSVRNELIHEASIEGVLPGTKADDTFYLSKWLDRLNARLIFAVAGYRNEFVRSGWWFFGWQRFDKYES